MSEKKLEEIMNVKLTFLLLFLLLFQSELNKIEEVLLGDLMIYFGESS